MRDAEILEYLLSHAPLERFYIFTPRGTEDTLMKYFDSAGVSWNLMEDDDETVVRAVAFLRKSGVKSFEDYKALLEYERREGNAGQ